MLRRLVDAARALGGRFLLFLWDVARGPARWDLLAAAVYAAVSLGLYGMLPEVQRPGSDGHYSWIYARSLAYDGDLDFTNDYELCGDPFRIGWTTTTGHRANMFYIGPAVFWTPAIWVLKHLVQHRPSTEALACLGPVPALVLRMSSIAGAVVVLASSAIARRWVGPRTAAVAALLAAFGGHLLYNTVLSPSYSHAYDAMCVALYLYVLVRVREAGATVPRLVGAGVLLGLAILQRSSNAVFLVVAAGALAWPGPKATPSWWRAALSLSLVGACAFLSGIVPLLAASRVIYGRPLLYTHGPHFLWPGHAHPLLLLFDERGGLFPAAPITWLAVPGLLLLLRLRHARWLAWTLLPCALFELVLSSAALDWQGGRRLVNLTPLTAWCIALVVARVARWVQAHPRRLIGLATATIVGKVAWANAAVAFAFAKGLMPWDSPLSTSERYGRAEKETLALVEDEIGSPEVAPAAWIFALRYHLPPVAFGRAAHPEWYQRDSTTLEYTRGDFPFTIPETRRLLRGLKLDEAEPGACFEGTTASAVFALQWPVTTRVRVVYDATAEVTLSARSRGFFGAATSWGAPARLEAGKQRRVFLPVPAEALDSGVNEVTFERGTTQGHLCLHSLEFVDDTRYPAAPEARASLPVHLWRAGSYWSEPSAAPTLAVGHVEGGDWMVEVHETQGGSLAWFVDAPGTFARPRTLADHGFHPRVAGDGQGAVVEVHQAQPGAGPLLSRVGRVSFGAGGEARVAWTDATTFDDGFHPAVAALEGRAVEVDLDGPSGKMQWRSGALSPSGVAWGAPAPLGPGHEPSVALSASPGGGDPLVVEVHQKGQTFGPMELRTGRLSAGGAIVWDAPREYDVGIYPCVVLLGRTLVEVHQGQDSHGPMWMKIGAIERDGRLTWRSTTKYDEGGHPVLALDVVSGRGLEAHEGGKGFAALWGHEVDVYGPPSGRVP